MTIKHFVDTHTFLWYLAGSPQVGNNAKAILQDAASALFFPATALAEACWIVQRGKVAITVSDILTVIDNDPRIVIVPLDRAIIERSNMLTAIGEMHDRQIVATALIFQDQGDAVDLLTKDANITASGFVPVGMVNLSPPKTIAVFWLAWCALLCVSPARADAPRRELRAFWADGFNEGYKTPQQIDTLLQRLHDAHCNAIFAQIRKGGDAYYASHYEPWATDDAGHFDALACLVERAHRMQPRIAVHAWINSCAVSTGAKHPGYHIAQLHPEWLSCDWRGNSDDGEVRKIDLGNPDGADWTFRLYLDVLRHYDVDGIHFDFVRYGSRRFGYNPVSVARFFRQLPPGYKIKPLMRNGVAQRFPDSQGTLAGQIVPDPADPAWKQWRRDQVTNFVRKVYAFAAQIKPRAVVSAATIAWGNGPHNEQEWIDKSAAMNHCVSGLAQLAARGRSRPGLPNDLFCGAARPGISSEHGARGLHRISTSAQAQSRSATGS